MSKSTKNKGSDKGSDKKRTLTNAEKLKLLEGYRKYEDPTTWDSIPIGRHIRILKKDGTFIRGGFVKAFYTIDGHPYMLVENRTFDQGGQGYFMFKIKLDTVKRIFVKNSDTGSTNPMQSRPPLPEIKFDEFKHQNTEIELLEKKINLLEKVIDQQNSELHTFKKGWIILKKRCLLLSDI